MTEVTYVETQGTFIKATGASMIAGLAVFMLTYLEWNNPVISLFCIFGLAFIAALGHNLLEKRFRKFYLFASAGVLMTMSGLTILMLGTLQYVSPQLHGIFPETAKLEGILLAQLILLMAAGLGVAYLYKAFSDTVRFNTRKVYTRCRNWTIVLAAVPTMGLYTTIQLLK